MSKKFLSLALALVMCLGLTVPAFAAETQTYTLDGITITATPDGTISYTGSGVLTTMGHTQAGLELFMTATNGEVKTVKINIGANIVYDESWLAEMKDDYSRYGLNVVISDSSAPVTQMVGGFTDVKESDYFADPVMWAVDKKITAGTSATTFSPNQNCTVAQILTFLYRAYGSPRVSGSNPFSDVKSSDYYYNAALWAAEKGMISGSTFGGDRPCTRSMAVTYMWKAASAANLEADFAINNGYLSQYTGSGSDVVIPNSVTTICFSSCYDDSLTSVTIPSRVTEIEGGAFFDHGSLLNVYYEGSEAQWKAINFEFSDELSKATIHYNSKMPQQPADTGFTDVPATVDYAQAVKWAVDKGVTSGTSATTFSPDSVCTRGQIVTFLYRGLAK